MGCDPSSGINTYSLFSHSTWFWFVFLFSFFSHFHEDITNLTEITCARRVAAGPGRVRVKIVISVTVTDSVYTGPSRLGVLSWAGRLRGAPLAVFADASV